MSLLSTNPTQSDLDTTNDLISTYLTQKKNSQGFD